MQLIIFITILLLLLAFILNKTKINKIEYFYASTNFDQVIDDNTKTYILWTGGYDSSFRVLQAVIDENKVVQPIYISDFIDNEKGKNTFRKNTQQEYNAMENITNLIKQKYPEKSNNILPLIDVKKIDVDDETKYYMKKLKEAKSVRRSTCQYGAIAQLSKDINENRSDPIYLEIGVVKEDYRVDKFRNIGIYNTINNNVNYKNKTLNKNLNNNAVKIFRFLKFPLIDLNKKDMLEIANKNGYSDILKFSWSCWYPKTNG